MVTVEGTKNLASFFYMLPGLRGVVPFEIKGVSNCVRRGNVCNVFKISENRHLSSITEADEKEANNDRKRKRAAQMDPSCENKFELKFCDVVLLRDNNKRSNENAGSREARRGHQSDEKTQKRVHESVAHKENMRKRRRDYMRKKMANESSECKTNRQGRNGENMKRKRLSETLNCKESRIKYQREYSKRKLANESVCRR